ncbi:MAG: hypothetical protein ACRECO_15955 [Xanthobacteraceae bacterium]
MASTTSGLEGLFDLDRQGVDIRPTLLRVLTDQYLQSPVHTPDEVRQYTELAMRLLDETDIATRAAVAERLAPHPDAPRPILLQLARDVLVVAEPILLHSPRFTEGDLVAVVRERGPSYADIIARRGQPKPANAGPQYPKRAPKFANEAAELGELFFAAGSAERRLILINLDYAAWPPAQLPAPLQRADIWRLESAALQHNSGGAVREIERALGVSQRQAQRIIEDEFGEPIVAAAKAMNLPADVLQRILLFMNPKVGQSVDRVYELAALYNEISADAARSLITILRRADPVIQQPRHETLTWHSAAETARRALSEMSSVPARERDPLLKRPLPARANGR